MKTDGSVIQAKRASMLPFTIFTIAFYIIHVAYTYVYGNTSYLQGNLILQIILRLVLWTLPVLVYLLAAGTNPLSYLKLTKNVISGVLWGIATGTGILLLNILRVYVFTGQVVINMYISQDFLWKGIILVGLSEEVLFRGFILQKVNERIGFWAANCVNAVLFVLVHVIGWVFLNQLTFPAKAADMIVLFLFALLQGFVLKKTKSLWACMIIHSFNNFTSAVL